MLVVRRSGYHATQDTVHSTLTAICEAVAYLRRLSYLKWQALADLPGMRHSLEQH
jgi:hypothetical protein